MKIGLIYDKQNSAYRIVQVLILFSHVFTLHLTALLICTPHHPRLPEKTSSMRRCLLMALALKLYLLYFVSSKSPSPLWQISLKTVSNIF